MKLRYCSLYYSEGGGEVVRIVDDTEIQKTFTDIIFPALPKLKKICFYFYSKDPYDRRVEYEVKLEKDISTKEFRYSETTGLSRELYSDLCDQLDGMVSLAFSSIQEISIVTS